MLEFEKKFLDDNARRLSTIDENTENRRTSIMSRLSTDMLSSLDVVGDNSPRRMSVPVLKTVQSEGLIRETPEKVYNWLFEDDE